MNQVQLKEAIASQEEHIKRVQPCAGSPDGEPRLGWEHSFDTFAPTPEVRVRQCWRCRVTETADDWKRLQSASTERA